jgi:hypothetical protein
MPRTPEIVAAVLRGSRKQGQLAASRSTPRSLVAAVLRGSCKQGPLAAHTSSREEDNWGPFYDDPESTGPRLNIQRYDPRRFTRGVRRCPHGILMTKKCAICDEEAFGVEYGGLST